MHDTAAVYSNLPGIQTMQQCCIDVSIQQTRPLQQLPPPLLLTSRSGQTEGCQTPTGHVVRQQPQ